MIYKALNEATGCIAKGENRNLSDPESTRLDFFAYFCRLLSI